MKPTFKVLYDNFNGNTIEFQKSSSFTRSDSTRFSQS